MVRVRIAPSPTGIPHIGNTRTALFNYLFAKKNKGKFILRIEDTDRKRIVPESYQAIDDILDWLKMPSDERYVQSERTEKYKAASQKLLKKGMAYEKEGAIWAKIPEGKKFSWTDAIGNKEISFESSVLKDFVILKSDGYPTYHLASVVDDHDMEITHVIRGDEWISSTPLHLLLYEYLGFEPPIFAHLPVILGNDKTKLSKRHGALSVLDYREQGYIEEAVVNYMALLGWSPKDDTEFLEINDLVEKFSLEGVNTGSPIFDMQKFTWLNGLHIRHLANNDLKKRLEEFDKRNKELLGDDNWSEIIDMSKSRIQTLADFYPLVNPFFGNEKKGSDSPLRKKLREKLSHVDAWKKDNILEVLLNFLKENSIRFPALYEVIIGDRRGLPLADTFEILGKNKTLSLLE